MDSAQITGKFVYENGQPVPGFITFMPDRLWVVCGGTAYATYAPSVELVDGEFTVRLSTTNNLQMRYHVLSPVGQWTIEVKGNRLQYLKDLIHLKAKRP